MTFRKRVAAVVAASNAPEQEEIGHIGDVSWAEYGGGPVYCRTPKGQTDIYGGDCFVEYVEPPEEDFEEQGATWTVYRVDLTPEVPSWGDLEDAAKTSGQDPEELRAAFESTDPMERAWAYETWAGHYGWHEFDSSPLTLTCAEMNERYDAGIDCYSTIQSAIEETVQRMADQNEAMAWSTPGDAMASDVEAEGFDPDTIVSIAEFGDAVAINGDLTDKTLHDIEGELERDGYELTRYGGRVPSSESEVSAEALANAVANDMERDLADVEKAAESIDWWQENIPWGSSGHASVWAKRAAAGVEESRRPRHAVRAFNRELAGEYHTRTGKLGAEIHRSVGRDGRATYSYIGEWGAGSGLSAADMQREVRNWFDRKRGIQTITTFVP